MIFHDIPQNSEAWDALRAGKPTSSKLACIMANYGKPFGDPARKYAAELALERVKGCKLSSGYSNEHMERGHEEEPLARMEYEEQTFSIVTNGGFFDHGYFGCSPDGLVGNDGVVEIKSALAHIHLERVRKQTFDSAYKWQLIGNMKFTGRAWVDFISYCSEFPAGKNLYVFRLHAKDYSKEFLMIDERLKLFSDLIEESVRDIETGRYFLINNEVAA